MSWSFHGTGKRDAVIAAIDAELARYGEGQSRQEFEEAAPHLKGLVATLHEGAAVSVNANGHATFENGVKTYAQTSVAIAPAGQFCE